MKKIAWIIASAMAAALLAGCGSSDKEEAAQTPVPAAQEEETETGSEGEEEAEDGAVTLNVFAAASMTETLEKIQEMYAEVEPDVSLVFNLDSSGTLKTQIQEGSECYLFISAAQ